MKSLNKTSKDLLSELEWEEKIRTELSDSILYFEYEEIEEETTLHLITISKSHGERFLFHRVKSFSRSNCLYEMHRYIVSDYKKNAEHYEIHWMKKKSGEKSLRSWFYGKSFLEVMDKFFYLKDPSEVSILEIKLMPLS
jgi:hypothetical protein